MDHPRYGHGRHTERVGGAFLLQRHSGFHIALDRIRDVLALILIGAGCSTARSASTGESILSLGG